MTELAIEAKDLHKNYSHKGQPAIDGLNFKILPGQLFGLVGPDGAGKTTTLRILSTVMEQSSGAVMIAGFDIRSQVEKARQHIGYMPQNFSLYPDLSVIENLHFFADLQDVPVKQKKKRIPELLAFSRLGQFQSRKAGNLSGGMKKKLALACALIHDPAVLLLDEPSTGVDPVSRRELWAILAEVIDRGVTALVSTPYMDEAERCHQVGIINQGKLLSVGAPDELEAALPFNILEVKAKPRKEMRRIAGQTQGVLEWRPVGDRLRLAVPNSSVEAKRILKSLKADFKKNDLDVRILREARKTMEDVFVHLAAQQRSAA